MLVATLGKSIIVSDNQSGLFRRQRNISISIIPSKKEERERERERGERGGGREKRDRRKAT